MNIALDIFLFLIIIAIIVILLWGGLTNWTFKSQGSASPSTYIISLPPQTLPPQTLTSSNSPSSNSYPHTSSMPTKYL